MAFLTAAQTPPAGCRPRLLHCPVVCVGQRAQARLPGAAGVWGRKERLLPSELENKNGVCLVTPVSTRIVHLSRVCPEPSRFAF